MRWPDGIRAVSRAGALAIALAVAPIPTTTSRAAEGHAPQILPRDAHVALVADVDADGANELVRITASRSRGHLLDVWRYDGSAWSTVGDVTVPGLEPSGIDISGPGTEASALLDWREAGRSKVLVLARHGAPPSARDELPCCVDAFELVVQGEQVRLDPLPMEGDVADSMQAADVDGDGTDELVRVTSSFSGDHTTIDVLRWDGEAFRELTSVDVSGPMWGLMVGQTDGVAGSDVLIGPQPDGTLQRVAWVDGATVVDDAHLDLGERAEGSSVSAVIDEAMVVSLPDSLRIIRWPRGEEPMVTARRDGLVYPYPGIIGSGPTTLLAVQEAYFGGGIPPSPLVLFDLALERVGSVAPSPEAIELSDLVSTQVTPSRGLARYPYPYIGQYRGARAEDPARFVWSGTLIEPGAVGGYQAEPISPMAGVSPIGLAGPADAWVALAGIYLASGSVAWLFPADVPDGFGTITMARADDLAGPGAAETTVTLVDAVVVAQRADGAVELMAGAERFRVVVEAPEGSWVTAWNGRQAQELAVTAPSTTLTIDAPNRPEGENTLLRASLLVVTPDGRVDTFEWDGTFIREAPELAVGAATDAFELSATVAGTTGPHATISIDGRQVPVGADGGFTARVDARPWPHHVVVTARDPLGNEVSERLEVVGLYDYRGLPWIAIVGVATVGAGATLFMRSPRRRLQEAPTSGDGRLEELDPLETVSLDGR